MARFLARHALPEREAVAADVAPYLDMDLDERFRHLAAACRAAASALAAMSEEDRARALAARQAPHPSWPALRRRLARERRAPGPA
ncbi:MAG: hypothetical protein AB7N76_28850 [Planctomycetota bacterium]